MTLDHLFKCFCLIICLKHVLTLNFLLLHNSQSQTIQFCKNRPRRAPKSEKKSQSFFSFSFLYRRLISSPQPARVFPSPSDEKARSSQRKKNEKTDRANITNKIPTVFKISDTNFFQHFFCLCM